MDTAYGELPPSMHVYRTQDPVSGKPNVAFYVVADLQDSQLDFRSDTSYKRRLTPFQFQEKLQAPYLVVNTSFFSFTTHQNLNMMMDRGVMTAYNVHSIPAKGKDSLKFRHPLVATLGITSNRKVDVAWTFTDSSATLPWASQSSMPFLMNESTRFSKSDVAHPLKKWKMQTAVSGGPVLVQEGKVQAQEFDRHAELEDSHWWFVVRREIMRDQILRFGAAGGLLEIGCGTGGNLRRLSPLFARVDSEG